MSSISENKKLNRLFSISTSFSLGAIFIMLAVLALCVSITGIFFSRNSLQNFYDSASKELSEFSDTITMFFSEKEGKLNVFAESEEVKAADSTIHSFVDESGEIKIPDYRKSLTEQRIRALCKKFAEHDPSIAEIYLGTRWGGYATNFDSSMQGGYDPRKRGWYATATEGKGKVMITDAFASTIGQTVVGITRSAYDRQKNFIGNASIEVSLDTLTGILRTLDFGKGSFVMMIQGDGTILADTSQNPNNFKNIEEISLPGLASIFQDGKTYSSLEIEGKTYFTQFTTNPKTGYRIIALAPKETVFQAFHKTLSAAITISLIFAFFTAAITLLLTWRITRPIKSMASFVKGFMQNIKDGRQDYTGRLRIKSRNEIGELAQNINLFIETLETVMAQIQKSQEKEMKTGAEILSQAHNLIESNTLSQNIELKVKAVADLAGKTNEDVAEGVGLLEGNVTQLSEIALANKATIDGIKALGDKIEKIWDIVSLINSVADQAKIIAFNAELEASTAGEAGKNFHIVATEIRRLADGIIDGTKEIKESISQIQQSSDSLILTSESETDKIQKGVQNANILSKRFESIKNASEVTAESSTQITMIIQQQAQSREQILNTLKQIAGEVENFSVTADNNISSASKDAQTIAEDSNK